MSNMREFINIMEGKIPEKKIEEGFGDWVMSKFGNKKAQGKQERAAITKQLFGQWNKWIGQTGASGTIQDMQTFLTKVAGFKPDEVQKILSGVSSSGIGGNTSQQNNQQSNSNSQQNAPQAQGQQQASNESFRYRRRNRLTEAPTIPLTKKQIQDMLNSAVKFIYTDLGGPTAQNQGGQQQGQQNNQQSGSQNSNNNQSSGNQDQQSQNNNNQSSGNQNQQTQNNNQSSGNQNNSSNSSSNSNKSSRNTQNKQSSNKPANAPSSFMTNLKNMGLTSEDLRDLSYTAKSGDTDVDSLEPSDQKLVTSIGWAYLKSLK